jgi:hypothetical protein
MLRSSFLTQAGAQILSQAPDGWGQSHCRYFADNIAKSGKFRKVSAAYFSRPTTLDFPAFLRSLLLDQSTRGTPSTARLWAVPLT